MKCQHENIDIIEHILSYKTHHVRQGSRVERSTSIGLYPRQFDVRCLNCGFAKSYRYGPGTFGTNARPKWLYRLVDGSNGEHWSGTK